jgi:hypothetical protein
VAAGVSFIIPRHWRIGHCAALIQIIRGTHPSKVATVPPARRVSQSHTAKPTEAAQQQHQPVTERAVLTLRCNITGRVVQLCGLQSDCDGSVVGRQLIEAIPHVLRCRARCDPAELDGTVAEVGCRAQSSVVRVRHAPRRAASDTTRYMRLTVTRNGAGAYHGRVEWRQRSMASTGGAAEWLQAPTRRNGPGRQ